jgi:integrase
LPDDENFLLFHHEPFGKMKSNLFSTHDDSSKWNASKIAVNRNRAGLPQVRVHNLKHTFGRRLREAGVSFEDRQDLLGHKSGRITTHYSMAEIGNLINSANAVCEKQSHKSPTLVILKKKFRPELVKQLGGTYT